MKIFVTGTRGVPDIPGGVETHCQNLYPLIAAEGHEVYISTRSSYVKFEEQNWEGVSLIKCFAPRLKSAEAIVHTFLAIIKARRLKPDVVHIHAVGPALFVFFARMLGLKVVFTNHGPDYDRQKWGCVAKFILRLGEKLGGKSANEVIVISKVIDNIMRHRCNRESNLIYNGVFFPQLSSTTSFLHKNGIKPKKYILAVARFVPEKGLHDLLEAFSLIDSDYQLVIAGDADHQTEYAQKLKDMAAQDERVVLTGYITGAKLNEIYTHARLFVLPSYHEGLPIVLLEALSYGLSVLASDIPANLEVELFKERYFQVGNIHNLSQKIKELLQQEIDVNEQDGIRRKLTEKFNWDRIAKQTINVYGKAIAAT